jgi:hypothetical protein
MDAGGLFAGLVHYRSSTLSSRYETRDNGLNRNSVMLLSESKPMAAAAMLGVRQQRKRRRPLTGDAVFEVSY